jgi:hypothetical protein
VELKKLKEGRMVNYKARVYSGRGRIIEIYRRPNGPWVIVHDAKRNVSITLRPSQILG